MISLIALTVKKQEGSTAESPRRFVRQAHHDNGFAFSAVDKTRQLPLDHLKSSLLLRFNLHFIAA